MKISIGDLLKIKKDFIELYEFRKKSVGANVFTDEHLESMKNIRGALKEIEVQLKSIEVEFDVDKMYLSRFEFKDIS